MANTYQNILLAVDFHKDGEAVIEKARKMAKLHDARLQLIHVHEPINMVAGGDGIQFVNEIGELEANYRSESERKLIALATELGIAETDSHFLEGRPASKIHEFCAENKIDLVVLGSHGKHGLQLLLGSTASSVLHNSVCDVLAVRIKSK
ncbi:MAG: universal stress protein [Verrucomicrobia bacterium]|nr:universal stress protein [Verrucomicrobiota bacterium]MDA1069290.1 universal stress protein [Verrucomicrobiota bacterium]